MKQLGRDMRTEGPQTVILAELRKAMQGGGEGGANTGLAFFAPEAFQAITANTRANNQASREARLDTEGTRQFDIRSRQFDAQEAGANRRSEAEIEEMRRRREADERKDPFYLPPSASNDPAQEEARRAKMQALGVDVLEMDKKSGKLTPLVKKSLQEEYEKSRPSGIGAALKAPYKIGQALGGTSVRKDENSAFIKKMVEQRYSPQVVQDFLKQSGKARGGLTEEEKARRAKGKTTSVNYRP
jgi:hypothetical protein